MYRGSSDILGESSRCGPLQHTSLRRSMPLAPSSSPSPIIKHKHTYKTYVTSFFSFHFMKVHGKSNTMTPLGGREGALTCFAIAYLLTVEVESSKVRSVARGGRGLKHFVFGVT